MVFAKVRRFWWGLWLAAIVFIMLGRALPVWADSMTAPGAETMPDAPAQPAHLFEIHCVGCHPNGGNIIRRGKNLKTRALKRYGYDDVASIADIITHGKGVMSAYGDRLATDEIKALAVYVLEQSEAGW
jgi:cytochrome c6